MDLVTAYVLIGLWIAVVTGNAVLNGINADAADSPIEPVSNSEPFAHEELLKIFERCGQEIASIKTLQWNAVYYLFAADAALVWIRKELVPHSGRWQIVLFGIALAVGVLAILFLFQCAWDRQRNQQRMRECRARFTYAARTAWGTTQPDRMTGKLLIIVVLVGTALTLLLLLRLVPPTN